MGRPVSMAAATRAPALLPPAFETSTIWACCRNASTTPTCTTAIRFSDRGHHPGKVSWKRPDKLPGNHSLQRRGWLLLKQWQILPSRKIQLKIKLRSLQQYRWKLQKWVKFNLSEMPALFHWQQCIAMQRNSNQISTWYHSGNCMLVKTCPASASWRTELS